MGAKSRLNAARRLVRELEDELNEYAASHPEMELQQLEKDRHYSILYRRLLNAEAVVETLERESK